MSKNKIPLAEEDIEQFQTLNQELEELSIRMGNLGMRKLEIEHNEYQLSNLYADITLKQQQLVQKYIKEYGNGGIDLDNMQFVIQK